MRVKCGVDIIEISRVQKSIDNLGVSFLNKIFTEKEIEYCEKKGKSRYEHYAARFAVKEAVFKAISKTLEDKYSISWKNIETTNDEQGRPRVEITNINNNIIEDIDISISHCKEYAIANAVVVLNN
ncbi:MAG TPA: holo-[acyl-carrier-protein] synthase [Clostridiales bacterium]|nr:holo-[acyl-carrier-protein] synthase [Clostridiales bacterium]